MELDGESLGVNFEDNESGKLTLNIGKTTLKDGVLEVCVDIRCPVHVANQKVIDIIKERVNKKNGSRSMWKYSSSLCIKG